MTVPGPGTLGSAYGATLGRRPALTGVVIALVIAFVLAFASNHWLPFRIGYVLLFGLAAGAFWTWAHGSGLQLQRRLASTRLQVGESFVERFEVENQALLPKLWLEVDAESDLPGRGARRVISLPSRSRRSWEVATPCVRRGAYTLGSVTVRVADLFDLFRSEQHFGRPQEILVYPRPLDLPGYNVPPANLPGEGRYRRRTHYVTPNAAGVRGYEPGDSFNRIHWPSTVRTGQLMVKTFELDPSSHLWVILDLSRPAQAGEGDESTVEYGVTTAASVARHFLAQNRTVGMLTCGAGMLGIEPDRGGQQLTRMLVALALAQPASDMPLASLLMQQSHRWGRHTTLVVISAAADPAWVNAMRTLKRRSVQMAAVLLDAESFGGARGTDVIEAELRASQIQTNRVLQGDSIPAALAPSTAAAGIGVEAAS